MDEKLWGLQLAHELTLSMLAALVLRGEDERIRNLFAQIDSAAEMTLRKAGKDFMLDAYQSEVLREARESIERMRETAMQIQM